MTPYNHRSNFLQSMSFTAHKLRLKDVSDEGLEEFESELGEDATWQYQTRTQTLKLIMMTCDPFYSYSRFCG